MRRQGVAAFGGARLPLRSDAPVEFPTVGHDEWVGRVEAVGAQALIPGDEVVHGDEVVRVGGCTGVCRSVQECESVYVRVLCVCVCVCVCLCLGLPFFLSIHLSSLSLPASLSRFFQLLLSVCSAFAQHLLRFVSAILRPISPAHACHVCTSTPLASRCTHPSLVRSKRVSPLSPF